MVDTSKNGYTSVLIESYGFDEDVFFIVQPRGAFLDFNAAYAATNIAKVYRVYFG